MPLQKVVFKPGVNRENTRYTNEGEKPRRQALIIYRMGTRKYA